MLDSTGPLGKSVEDLANLLIVEILSEANLSRYKVYTVYAHGSRPPQTCARVQSTTNPINWQSYTNGASGGQASVRKGDVSKSKSYTDLVQCGQESQFFGTWRWGFKRSVGYIESLMIGSGEFEW